jgi:peptidoglycan/LPS O-acetylase OafA/YrhL
MDALPNVSPLPVMWTLCIEEHFYLVWAIVLYFIPIKRFGWLLIISICVANISRILFYVQDWPFVDLLTNIDYFAFGAIPAFLYIQYGMRLENFILQIPFWQILFLITLVVVYVITSMQLTFPCKELIEPTILGLLFSGLVFFIIPQNSVIKISDRNIFSLLGKYTYGLYLTHTIVINLLIQIYKKMDLHLHIISNGISFFLLSLICVILVGIIVFYVVERPFLHLKKFMA